VSAAPGGFPGPLARNGPRLDQALRESLAGEPEALAAAGRYVMGWENADGTATSRGGKRIRPLLCLFAAEAFGGSADEAMPGAVAVELVHNFSLVHDEVQDHDAQRHGQPTTWARLGEAQAINVGDFLLTRAVRALVAAPGPPDRRMAALAFLNDAIERMIAGQWQDITFESRESVGVEEYLAMVAGKTGALLEAPVAMGALLAGVPAGTATAVGEWGWHIGLAFQAHDDYLGTWGDPGQTGKSNSNDIARRKKTLPVVMGLGDASAAPVIRAVYAQDRITADDVATVRKALEVAGADELCREQARHHTEEAEQALEPLSLPAERRAEFREIAAFLVRREF
jgi:geranylgeranyl diphosphate synthase type I